MLRVMSFNAQHMLPGVGRRQSLDLAQREPSEIVHPRVARRAIRELARSIEDINPDVIALQEVDLRQARSGRLDQVQVLADALGLRYHQLVATFAGPLRGIRRRPRDSRLLTLDADPLGPIRGALAPLLGTGQTVGYGNAIMSRYPVRSWHMRRLGHGPWLMQYRGPAGFPCTWKQVGDVVRPQNWAIHPSNARSLLAAQIVVPRHVLASGGVSLGCAHLAMRSDVAAGQLADAWGALGTLPGPHLLLGDFNMREADVARCLPARRLGEGATFPAGEPRHRIDHILADPWPSDAAGRPSDASGRPSPWPSDAAGLPSDAAGLPSDASGRLSGASGRPHSVVAGGEGAGSAPSQAHGEGMPGVLVARSWGVRTLPLSDHAATWADCEWLPLD